ncbi:MAG: hypothetical protein WCK58_11515 [Chloroflexota bacterium]
MQLIVANLPPRRSNRFAVVRSVVVAVLLLAAGLSLAWLCLGTPLVREFVPDGRPSFSQAAVGAIAWGFAIMLPAAFLVLGVAQLAIVIDRFDAGRPRRVTGTLAAALGPDHFAAAGLSLPGGRRIGELVMGPFGIVVLGDVPPAKISRQVGSHWELKDDRGRWIPIEHPVERAARDAERLRGWLSTDDRDFLVRIYAAVATDDPRVQRSPTCAVVPTADLAAWLKALPFQRGLTDERRARLVELIRLVATVG